MYCSIECWNISFCRYLSKIINSGRQRSRNRSLFHFNIQMVPRPDYKNNARRVVIRACCCTWVCVYVCLCVFHGTVVGSTVICTHAYTNTYKAHDDRPFLHRDIKYITESIRVHTVDTYRYLSRKCMYKRTYSVCIYICTNIHVRYTRMGVSTKNTSHYLGFHFYVTKEM